MSANPGDMRAVVLEEFVDSNALLGIVKVTLRPVPDGLPVDAGTTHSSISLGDEAQNRDVAELDDQATNLLANVLMKDGQRDPNAGTISFPFRLARETWRSFLLLLKGGLGGQRNERLPGSEVEWHGFRREVTRFLRKNKPVERSRGIGGDDV